MICKVLLLFLLAVCISCSQQSAKTNDIFIVPKRQKPQFAIKSNEPPPSPGIQTYYLPSNFIVDTTGKIFFYQRLQYGWFCSTGINWDTPPEFIDLKPKDIIQIPVDDITEFVKVNILNLNSSQRRVAIASIIDTIKSEGLAKLFNTFYDTSNHIKWTFRTATQEESIVLKFKKLNWEYYSDNVKWDSTKTRFQSIIKFTPPRFNDK